MGLSRPPLMGTFLLSDLCPAFLQPLSVQVACGGAEREADYSQQHGVKHAEMQKPYLGEDIPSVRVC